jgi:DEAD/DEAH box helicase domain-containing protein
MHTRGVFLAFVPDSPSAAALDGVPEEMRVPVVSRTATLVRVVAPVFLLSKPGDLGVAGRILDPHHGVSGIYAYDNYPGGIGLAESLAHRLSELLHAALDLIRACPCEEGCPSCVGAMDERDLLPENPKDTTRRFLEVWIKDS